MLPEIVIHYQKSITLQEFDFVAGILLRYRIPVNYKLHYITRILLHNEITVLSEICCITLLEFQ